MRQWATFSTVKVNMAVKPEVLITLLLCQIERYYEAKMGLQSCPHVDDLERQRATPSSAEYPTWRAITGSGNNLAISSNVVIVTNPKQAYAPIDFHSA